MVRYFRYISRYIDGGTWKNADLQICGLLPPVTPLILVSFQRNSVGTHLEKKLIYICIKKFHRFYYTFELMIHFLAEKENKKFLNIHLDILLSYTSWGLNSVEYSKFFNGERL